MNLTTSTVHRKLDAKLKIAGLEAPDLLAVLIFAAVMNLLFGQTSLGPPLVVVLPCIAMVVLYFGKRDKPDGYLIHLARFYLTPGFWDAGLDPTNELKLNERIIDADHRL